MNENRNSKPTTALKMQGSQLAIKPEKMKMEHKKHKLLAFWHKIHKISIGR